MLTILLIVLLIMALGGLPSWPHAANWGYGPSGILFVIVIVLLIYLLMGGRV